MRAHIKEKWKLILGRIMQKTNLNKKALRRTARRAQERRIFKPAALAKAIASVFVCGVLSGNVVGAPIVVSAQIEIGGVSFRAAHFDFGNGDVKWDGPFTFEGSSSSLPTTWSFKTSEAFANFEEGANDIDLASGFSKAQVFFLTDTMLAAVTLAEPQVSLSCQFAFLYRRLAFFYHL